jgi:hypothetical protein
MSQASKKDRRSVEVVNPRPGTPSHLSRNRAQQYCDAGIAYYTKDGRLRFRGLDSTSRTGSDVYIRGKVLWNGESKNPFAMFKPGEIRS